jgi:mono/diheme cytochrome c family protein
MKLNKLLILGSALAILAACSEYNKKPGTIYMPDMAYSRAYEYYSENPNYTDGKTAQGPVAGTMPRGAASPYRIKEEDTLGAKATKYEGSFTMKEIEEGGRIYNIHCGVCHGTALDGNGPLYKGGEGKYPAAPANFKDGKYLNMPVGTMYHAIMYGKNLMGAYSSQLDYKQRWMVLAYIKSEQEKNGGAPLAANFTISDGEKTKAASTEAPDQVKPSETIKEDATKATTTTKDSTKQKI